MFAFSYSRYSFDY